MRLLNGNRLTWNQAHKDLRLSLTRVPSVCCVISLGCDSAAAQAAWFDTRRPPIWPGVIVGSRDKDNGTRNSRQQSDSK